MSLDLRTDNEVQADDRLSEQFGQTESDSEIDVGNEQPALSEELQVINDGIHDIEIESPPRKLKQSQNEFFCQKIKFTK